MIKSLGWRLINFLHHHISSPRMIVGFKNNEGKYLTDVRISNTVAINAKNNLKIAANVYIAHYVVIEASNGLEIGEGCQISAYVLITTHSSHHAIRLYGKHYIEHNTKHQAYVKGSIKIGAYSFIGPHSIIMPEVVIAKGSLVHAFSRVIKGIYPEFAILAGNPAKVIGDTRIHDNFLLEQLSLEYPKLVEYYNEWARC